VAFAVERLRQWLDDCRVSSVIETAPVGLIGPQDMFLNAAAVGTTALDPSALLAALLDVERQRGRVRPSDTASKSARTLDLDLVLFGDRIIDVPGLQVPHPRFRDRLFVLEPLVEIAPDLVDPVSHRTVLSLYRAARARL